MGFFPADEPKSSTVKPILVVELDRKEPVSYDKDIEPILVKKCNFCHSGNIKEGKLDLSSFDSMMKGGKKGKPVVPGKAMESRLYLLSGKTERPLMPPKSEEPLTPQELALIKLWINQGAKPPSAVRTRPKVVVTVPPATVAPVRGLAIARDKSILVASRGNQVHVYDANSGVFLRSLLAPDLKKPDGTAVKAAHVALVESLALSQDGKFIATGGFQEVRLWDTQTGAHLAIIPAFVDRVVAVAFSNDSKLLATAGGAPTEEGEIKIFQIPTGKLIIDIKNAHSDTAFGVAFSSDGKMLATCGADKFVKVFEVPTGKFLKSFEGHTHHVLDVGWKSDGKLLASCGADNAIKVWDYEKGEQARAVQGHTRQISRLQFLGTTPQFATCSGDKTLRVWNVDNGGQVRTIQGLDEFLYALGASPDGSLLAAGGEKGFVYLYNQGGQLIKKIAPPGVVTEAPEPPKK
ncbi:MAG: NB-ARC domain protein [Gemmataceae bacterium]|nr:NB-ARC domain protein [Gemmataceae bacterium]